MRVCLFLSFTMAFAVRLAGSGTVQDAQRSPSVSQSKMGNAAVVEMVRAGLSEQVIINAIRQSTAREFNLSASGLIALKKAQVPDSVVVAMQDADSPQRAGAGSVGTLAGGKPTYRSFYRKELPSEKPPFGWYLTLYSDGRFRLTDMSGHAQTTDRGTYMIDGSAITFVPGAAPQSKHLLTNNPGVRIEEGRILEPDGSIWIEATPKPKSSADTEPATAATSTPTAPQPCTGIEMMGLYQNKIFDRAMGGGVVEWLANIRNNTSVTKIVVFGWIDQYGQQQKSQVQIRGGDIASPRVDLTQARYIAPVKELRVITCE